MGSEQARYTPLELLLLFRSSLVHGAETESFGKISETLMSDEFVKEDELYDPMRLTPELLQRQFFRMVGNELRGPGDKDGIDGATTVAAMAGKKKPANSLLPSLAEVAANLDKVASLVQRLYIQYREHTIQKIQEEERLYENVQKEIVLIKKSENERLARLAATQRSREPQVPATREVKIPSTPHTIVPNPATPAPASASNAKRPPVPITPVAPPKPPTHTTTPSHPQPTTPARSPSTQPPSGSAPTQVLQAPTGVSQQPLRTLQPPQAARSAVSPRLPETPHKTPILPPQGAQVQAQGQLKWEKPYQPQAIQTPPPRPYQSSPAPPKAVLHQQHTQNSQQWQQNVQARDDQQAQGQIQTPVQPPDHMPLQSTPSHQQPAKTPVLISSQAAGQAIQPPQPSPSRPAAVAQSSQPRPPAKVPTPALASNPVANRVIQPTQTRQVPPAQQKPRPIISASPTPVANPSAPPQGWPQGHHPQQQVANVTPAGSPASAQQDSLHSSPYTTQPTKPALPEHMIRHAGAGTPKVPKAKRTLARPPQTPVRKPAPAATPLATDTVWTPKTTKTTPQPSTDAAEMESPAYEPLSPPSQPLPLPKSAPAKQISKPIPSVEEASPKPSRSRTRSVQKGTATWAGRRAQSVASQPDELAMDQPEYSTKIKNEIFTPRVNDDTGETTADESIQGRDNYATPGSISRVTKRRRQDTPPAPNGPPTHVMWTRGFTKVSSSALDQISSHRDANMFATTVREKNAPNYRQIVLQPQDITSIRSAIKSGNKAAHQAANNLPNGDPGTATIWLPLSEDLVPPKGIINSAQLEAELVHMFCNAIMYNPDPQRGPGPSFMKRSTVEEEEALGYLMDENGVVKNTVAMFLEVEKLLGDLRSAEKERSAPPASNNGNAMSTPRPASMLVTTPADDTAEEEDELAGDGDAASGTASRKRRMTYKS